MTVQMNQSSLILGALSAIALLLVGCGSSPDDSRSAAPIAAQVGMPSTALVGEEPTMLNIDVESAISPSGRARVSPENGHWCLEVAATKQCVAAASDGAAAGGLRWRDDERAIMVVDGGAGVISIIDFDNETSVETDFESFRILDWSPDGTSLVGVSIEEPNKYVRIDPETLATKTFGELDSARIPQLFWERPGLIWGSATDKPRVFVMNDDGGDVTVIEGGLGAQDIISIDAQARLGLALDDDVAHGVGVDENAALHIFDLESRRAVAIELPAGRPFGNLTVETGQLAADGKTVLVLASLSDEPFGLKLLAVPFDAAASSLGEWVELAAWGRDDPLVPASYSSQGTLSWDGGSTAWIFTESGGLLRVELS